MWSNHSFKYARPKSFCNPGFFCGILVNFTWSTLFALLNNNHGQSHNIIIKLNSLKAFCLHHHQQCALLSHSRSVFLYHCLVFSIRSSLTLHSLCPSVLSSICLSPLQIILLLTFCLGPSKQWHHFSPPCESLGCKSLQLVFRNRCA